jgi:hypothetical protein
MAWEIIPEGIPIPPKVWLRAGDVLAEYARCGAEFVSNGRPERGEIADKFRAAELEYQQMANAIWFAKIDKYQREEWSLILRDRG